MSASTTAVTTTSPTVAKINSFVQERVTKRITAVMKRKKKWNFDKKKNSKKKKKTTGNNNSDILLFQTQNVLAGLASAIALIPEASTFAMTAGLSPLVGLGSTIIMSACSGVFGGRPGLVSGASATCSMIVKPLCETDGHLTVSLAVVMAGFFQLLLGLTRCGRYIRVIPKPVMIGFVNGLSIKVLMAQVPHFQIHDSSISSHGGVWLQGDALKWHSLIVAASAIIIEFLGFLPLPSPLIALVLAAVCANQFDLPVPLLVDIVGEEVSKIQCY